MPIRPPSARLLAGLLTLSLLGLPKSAAAAPPAAEGSLVTRTYPVADLVIPIPSEVSQSVAPRSGLKPKTQEDRLDPAHHDHGGAGELGDKGGSGTIDYHPLTMGLVIRQTPDVQEQIVDLLASLRRMQDTQVALEVRFVSVEKSFLDRLDLDGKDGPETKPAAADSSLRVTFLDDAQATHFLKAVQGDANANVMQAPKVTMFNGQSSVLDVTQPESFVTGVQIRAAPNGNLIFQPLIEDVPIGLNMTTRPVVSADRRFVKLSMNVDLTKLGDPKADLISVPVPVMSPSKPGDEMFTQLIQCPRISRLELDRTFTVPDGGTALISGWQRDRDVRTESGVPVLRDIPYLDRLFKSVGYSREKECVLMLVTPRVIAPAEAEEVK